MERDREIELGKNTYLARLSVPVHPLFPSPIRELNLSACLAPYPPLTCEKGVLLPTQPGLHKILLLAKHLGIPSSLLSGFSLPTGQCPAGLCSVLPPNPLSPSDPKPTLVIPLQRTAFSPAFPPSLTLSPCPLSSLETLCKYVCRYLWKPIQTLYLETLLSPSQTKYPSK